MKDISEFFEKDYKLTDGNKQPGSFPQTAMTDDEMENFVRNRIPDSLPGPKKIETKKELREDFIKTCEEFAEWKNNILKQAERKAAQSGKKRFKEPDRPVWTMIRSQEAFEQQDNLALQETVVNELAGVLTESAEEYRARMFKSYQQLCRFFKDGAFSPERSDRELVSDFFQHNYFFYLANNCVSDFNSLAAEMDNAGELTTEQRNEISAMKQTFERCGNYQKFAYKRLNLMLNPIFPYLGHSRLTASEVSKLTDMSYDKDIPGADENKQIIPEEINNLRDELQKENIGTSGNIVEERRIPDYKVEEIREFAAQKAAELKKDTRFGRSSTLFEHIREALEDISLHAAHMNSKELELQLKSISEMAGKYLQQKKDAGINRDTLLAHKKNYQLKRYDVITGVGYGLRSFVQKLEETNKAGISIRKDSAPMNAKTREILKKNLRRGMRGSIFDADRFAAWKSLTAFDGQKNVSEKERTEKMKEIRNSEAVRHMSERLKGKIAENEKVLDQYYEAFKSALTKENPEKEEYVFTNGKKIPVLAFLFALFNSSRIISDNDFVHPGVIEKIKPSQVEKIMKKAAKETADQNNEPGKEAPEEEKLTLEDRIMSAAKSYYSSIKVWPGKKPETSEMEVRRLIVTGIDVMVNSPVREESKAEFCQQNILSMEDYAKQFAPQLKLRKQLYDYILDDPDIRNIVPSGKKVPLKEMNICTKRDIKAIAYLEMKEAIANLNKNCTLEALTEVQEKFGEYIFTLHMAQEKPFKINKMNPRTRETLAFNTLKQLRENSAKFAQYLIGRELPAYSGSMEIKKAAKENLKKIKSILNDSDRIRKLSTDFLVSDTISGSPRQSLTKTAAMPAFAR